MSNRLDRELFLRVFSDSHVIDIDMSEWDKRISIWVLADHWEDWQERCPVVVVDFWDVHEFSFTKRPALRESLKHVILSDDQHVQWRIHDYEIKEEASSIRIRLHAMDTSPVLEIVCKSVEFRRVAIELIDTANPAWCRPGAGFARPNIEKLVELRKPDHKVHR